MAGRSSSSNRAQTGNPFNIITNIATITGVSSVRPDLIGALPAINRIRTTTRTVPGQYSGSTARHASAIRASRPAVVHVGSVFACRTTPRGVAHFGNLGRNAIYGPGFGNTDFSIIKNLKLQGSARAQLRARGLQPVQPGEPRSAGRARASAARRSA
jgi:hypothetical protein